MYEVNLQLDRCLSKCRKHKTEKNFSKVNMQKFCTHKNFPLYSTHNIILGSPCTCSPAGPSLVGSHRFHCLQDCNQCHVCGVCMHVCGMWCMCVCACVLYGVWMGE